MYEKKKLFNPKFLQTLLQNQHLVEFIGKMPTVKQLFFSVLGVFVLGFLFLALRPTTAEILHGQHYDTRICYQCDRSFGARGERYFTVIFWIGSVVAYHRAAFVMRCYAYGGNAMI